MKVAVIGCGGVATERHMPALRMLPGADLMAVADTDRARADEASRRFAIPQVFNDYREMLEYAGAEVVAVCVPARLHRQVACDVLAAGKHLFLEKPLALTREDCQAILTAAGSSRTLSTIGFNLRWHHLVRRARDWIRAGRLGEPQLIRSVLTGHTHFNPATPAWRHRRSDGGGVFFEMSPHHLDLWRFLLDTEIEQVLAISAAREWEDDRGAIMARLSNGVLATLELSQSTRATNEVDVYGVTAHAAISCYRFDGLELIPRLVLPGDMKYRVKQAFGTLNALRQAWPVVRRGGYWVDSFRAQWEHFLAAIRGETALETTLEDGRRAFEASVAAIESATDDSLDVPAAR